MTAASDTSSGFGKTICTTTGIVIIACVLNKLLEADSLEILSLYFFLTLPGFSRKLFWHLDCS